MLYKIIKDLTSICLMAGKDYYSFLCYIDIRKRIGKIIFRGTQLQDLNSDELAAFRKKHCGFVFQSIYLLENMSILDFLRENNW